MAKASLYPASPVDIPEDLTEPSADFRTQTVLVLLALALFFILYFGLMFLCFVYCVWAVLLSPIQLRVFAILMVLPIGILFIYMLKNLLKFERAGKDFQIEIFEDEHPKLFEFIETVCDEVGATMPKHVYVDYRVNAAAVLHSTSLFHLFLPKGKSLMIGLGLVNAVNLTEFKAVLAHEFGHFAQESLKIVMFVNTVRGILYQVVHGEDFFDRFIIGWSQQDARIAFPAHIVPQVCLWGAVGPQVDLVCRFLL